MDNDPVLITVLMTLKTEPASRQDDDFLYLAEGLID
jgi:hypothetical protein